MMLHSVVIAAVMLLCSVNGFYIPGMAPVEYEKGQPIEVKAVKMTSSKTLLPYEYYSAPVCMPQGARLEYKSENLGEVLRGDRIVNTPFIVRMAVNQTCRIVCQQKLDAKQSSDLDKLIKHEYFVHLLLDNLPVATRFTLGKSASDDISSVQYEHGYRLGFVKDDTSYINNHLTLIVRYHFDEHERYRIVGFEVEPRSVAHGQLVEKATHSETKAGTADKAPQAGAKADDKEAKRVKRDVEPAGEPDLSRFPSVVDSYSQCVVSADANKAIDGTQAARGAQGVSAVRLVPQAALASDPKAEHTVLFTYDVQWFASDVRWASRWDLYLRMSDVQIHWFSIVNSLVVVLFLAGIIAMILIRALRRDIAKYNKQDELVNSSFISFFTNLKAPFLRFLICSISRKRTNIVFSNENLCTVLCCNFC